MPAAKLTSKGQITIPRAVRVALGLHTGTRVDFVPVADGFLIVPLCSEVTSLKGPVRRQGCPSRQHRRHGSSTTAAHSD